MRFIMRSWLSLTGIYMMRRNIASAREKRMAGLRLGPEEGKAEGMVRLYGMQ